MATIELFTANILNFVDVVATNIKGCSVESRLTLTGLVRVNMAAETLDSRLWLSQVAKVNKTLLLNPSNTLSFTQFAHPKSILAEAYNGFIFWHEVSLPKHDSIGNSLAFQQTAIGVGAKAGRNTLALTHTVDFELIKVYDIVSTFEMISTATAWKEDKHWIGVPSLVYPSSVGPPVTFRYKETEFEFIAPLLGNRDSIEYLRISRESLGGDRQVYRDSNWPIIQNLYISFDVCKESDMAKIRDLIKRSLGDFIEYQDHNGVWYDAFIANPNTAIRQSGRKAYVVDLQLEATPQI